MGKKYRLTALILVAGFSLAMNIAMLVSTSLFKLVTTTFEAVTSIPTVASKIHPKNTLVKFKGKTVRVAAAVGSTANSIKKRAVRTASRSVSSMAFEAIPYAGITAIVGVTAWELKDLCETANDIEALNQALNPDEEISLDQSSVCSVTIPNKEELLLKAENTSESLRNKVKSYLSEIRSN